MREISIEKLRIQTPQLARHQKLTTPRDREGQRIADDEIRTEILETEALEALEAEDLNNTSYDLVQPGDGDDEPFGYHD